MDRRRFLTTSLAGALAKPLAAEAQQGSGLPRIVVLSLSSPPDHARALEEGLRSLGYTPGMTIAIDHRSAETRADALPALAAEVVGLQPRIIVAIGTTAAIAARRATKDIPIVAVTGDITAAGLVANLRRPEANVTGLSFFAFDLMLKRFELLMELVPRLRRLAAFTQSPVNSTQTKSLDALRTAAGKKKRPGRGGADGGGRGLEGGLREVARVGH